MRKLIISFALLLFSYIASVKAATNITTSSVSGHWTLAGSPYLIFNNIQVDICSGLTIDPGVEVIFQGSYSLEVYGWLHAEGTSTNYIKFRINDTTGWSLLHRPAGGWLGINYHSGTCGADSSAFTYCDIADVKSGLYSSVLGGLRGNKLENCRLHHLSSMFSIVSGNFLTYEIGHCQFYDIDPVIDSNSMGRYPFIGFGATDTSIQFYVHDCEFHNMSVIAAITMAGGKMLFKNNSVYNNTGNPINLSQGVASLVGNKIYNNTDDDVAAISACDCKMLIEQNYICNNYSKNGYATDTVCGNLQGGGGIRISTSQTNVIGPPAIIRNNVIANNGSGYGGGGIYTLNISTEISNNHFINNTGTIGTAITISSFDATVYTNSIIKNNLFYHNVAISYTNNGSGIVPTGYDTVDVHISYGQILFENNFVTRSPITALSGTSHHHSVAGDLTTNLAAADPKLINPTHTINVSESALTANFGLAATSPCINKGSTTYLTSAPADYAGNVRIFGSIIDIGAYEYGAPHLSAPAQSAAAGKMINAYPNPSREILFISIPSATGSVQLLDMTGKTMTERNIDQSVTFFDVRHLPRGMYIVVYTGIDGKKEMEQILIQ